MPCLNESGETHLINWCLRAGSRVVTHGGQDVEDVHAAGDGDQVVQQVVVAQEDRPLAAMAAVPAVMSICTPRIPQQAFSLQDLTASVAADSQYERSRRGIWRGRSGRAATGEPSSAAPHALHIEGLIKYKHARTVGTRRRRPRTAPAAAPGWRS